MWVDSVRKPFTFTIETNEEFFEHIKNNGYSRNGSKEIYFDLDGFSYWLYLKDNKILLYRVVKNWKIILG